MTKIAVYDGAMCCSTGVCGVDVDQELVTLPPMSSGRSSKAS